MLVANPLAGHHGRDDLDNDTYIVGALQSGSSPNGHGTAGTNDQAVAAGHIVPIQSVQAVREKKQNGIGIGDSGDPMFTMTGRDQHAIAFDYKQSGEVNPTMRSLSHDKSHANNGNHLAVAYNRNCGSFSEPELCPSLRASSGSGSQSLTGVRRLTPRECERLMGMPDDYTLIPYRGKPASDGPRYRALGNSMAVPVMAWIGERIQMVEDLCRAEERRQA